MDHTLLTSRVPVEVQDLAMEDFVDELKTKRKAERACEVVSAACW